MGWSEPQCSGGIHFNRKVVSSAYKQDMTEIFAENNHAVVFTHVPGSGKYLHYGSVSPCG